MGYDIYMVKTPTAAIPGYRPQTEGCPEYIRLAGTSMPEMVEIMRAAGVIDDEAEHPAFPDWPPDGLEDERAGDLQAYFEEEESIEPPPTAREAKMMRAYLAARDAITSTRSQQRGKVPAFKFRSNNNWLVTPAECNAIAAGLERFMEANQRRQTKRRGTAEEIDWDGVRLWAGFNRVAARHGGYRVG